MHIIKTILKDKTHSLNSLYVKKLPLERSSRSKAIASPNPPPPQKKKKKKKKKKRKKKVKNPQKSTTTEQDIDMSPPPPKKKIVFQWEVNMKHEQKTEIGERNDVALYYQKPLLIILLIFKISK